MVLLYWGPKTYSLPWDHHKSNSGPEVPDIVIVLQASERLMFVVTLFYGGHLVERGLLSGGMLVSFILYQLELGECIEV